MMIINIDIKNIKQIYLFFVLISYKYFIYKNNKELKLYIFNENIRYSF